MFPDSSEEGRLALSDLMMTYWANIAKYGNPNEFVRVLNGKNLQQKIINCLF